MEKARRKELLTEFRQSRPEAGVYRILNSGSGKALLASASNLQVVRNKLDFAQSTRSTSLLDRRLVKHAQAYGVEALSLEVLEVLQPTAEMTDAELGADLTALEELWREKLDAATLY